MEAIYLFSVCARRFHDLSYSGIVLLFIVIFSIAGNFLSFGLSFVGMEIGSLGLIVIPVLFLFFITFLIFKPGVKNTNKYGPPPNRTNYLLNITLGIITILFSFVLLSLPYVQSLFPQFSEYFLSKAIIPKTRTVMAPGMEILAQTPSQQIRIKAGEALLRTYVVDNCDRTVTLTPRIDEWMGSQGAYSAGLYVPSLGNMLLASKDQNCPNDRILGDESERDFNSEKEAVNWLKQNYKDNLAYNNSGLVVAWKRTESQYTFNIDIWQIFINGQKPSILEGADDSSIQVK